MQKGLVLSGSCMVLVSTLQERERQKPLQETEIVLYRLHRGPGQKDHDANGRE